MRKLTIDQVKLFASSINYSCLSESCESSSQKLEFLCSNGHKVLLTYNKLQSGRRCKFCNKLYHETEVEKILNDIGYKLIDKFININAKMKMICNNGHLIEMDLANIIEGHICKQCSVDKLMKEKDEELKVFCEKVGFELLGVERRHKIYINIKCVYNHITKRLVGKFKRNPICLICKPISIEEKVVRTIVEDMFEKQFPSIYPSFLVWKTGFKLQLDMYNEEEKLAFEYQGRQHYYYIKKFYKDEAEFIDRQNRDKWKIERCNEVGITLVQIPTIHRQIKVNDIPNFICEELKRKNKCVEYIKRDINIFDVYKKVNYNPHRK